MHSAYIYIHTYIIHIIIYIYILNTVIYNVMYAHFTSNGFECSIYAMMHACLHHFMVSSPQANPFAFWGLWFWRNTCLRDEIFMKFWKLCVALIWRQILIYSDEIDTGTRTPYQNIKPVWHRRYRGRVQNEENVDDTSEVGWCVVIFFSPSWIAFSSMDQKHPGLGLSCQVHISG